MNEYKFEEITVGQTGIFQKTITVEMENLFRQITGDENPLHRDDAFAMEIGGGKFKSHIAFGLLTASFYSTLAGVYLPGKYSLIHSIDHIKLKSPVYVGDTLTIKGTVEEKTEALKLIAVFAEIKNQNQKIVSTARMKIIVQK